VQPKKILIVAPGPLLLDHGWHIRTYQLVQHFEKMGFIPEIFILYPKEWGPLPDEWLGLTREYNLRGIVYYKVLKGYYPSLKTFLAINEIKREYEFILFRFEKLAFQSLFFLIGKKIIIDYDDFVYPTISKYGLQKLKSFIIYKLANIFCKSIFVLNLEHLKYFSKGIWVPALPVYSLPRYKNNSFIKKYSKSPALIFVGQDPSDLISFLVKYWPTVVKNVPDIKIIVISKNTEKFYHQVSNIPNVELHNNVKDLTEYYSKCWGFLMLSKHNLGVHIKIIESLYWETPVFTLSNCIRGYEHLNEKDEIIQVAKNEELLSTLLISSMSDLNNIRFISSKGKKIVLDQYNFEKITEKIINSL